MSVEELVRNEVARQLEASSASMSKFIKEEVARQLEVARQPKVELLRVAPDNVATSCIEIITNERLSPASMLDQVRDLLFRHRARLLASQVPERHRARVGAHLRENTPHLRADDGWESMWTPPTFRKGESRLAPTLPLLPEASATMVASCADAIANPFISATSLLATLELIVSQPPRRLVVSQFAPAQVERVRSCLRDNTRHLRAEDGWTRKDINPEPPTAA